MFRIANLTLESKFKVKYTCTQAVCIVMATPHEFLDGRYSYLTQCLPEVS